MSRHRGYRSPISLEVQFPYVVEEPIPPMGLKVQLDLIEAWIIDNVPRHRYARWGRRRDMQDFAVWAFTDQHTAAAFRIHVDRVMKLSDRQATKEAAKQRSR
jgi:hypothetical protein